MAVTQQKETNMSLDNFSLPVDRGSTSWFRRATR